jgi:hypothetical protein
MDKDKVLCRAASNRNIKGDDGDVSSASFDVIIVHVKLLFPSQRGTCPIFYTVPPPNYVL